MSGTTFLTALKAAIAPRKIVGMTGKSGQILIKLNNGTTIEARRSKARASPSSYATELAK